MKTFVFAAILLCVAVAFSSALPALPPALAPPPIPVADLLTAETAHGYGGYHHHGHGWGGGWGGHGHYHGHGHHHGGWGGHGHHHHGHGGWY